MIHKLNHSAKSCLKRYGFDPENPPFVTIYTLRCPNPEVITSKPGILLPEKDLVVLQ